MVVMTQRDKIGMEALFRRVIPPHKRHGSQFVFRQARSAAQLAPVHVLPAHADNCLKCQSCSSTLAVNVVAAGRLVPAYNSNAVYMTGEKEMERELCKKGIKQGLHAQGSPLVPADLKMVSASSAGATVIVSDTSRLA